MWDEHGMIQPAWDEHRVSSCTRSNAFNGNALYRVRSDYTLAKTSSLALCAHEGCAIECPKYLNMGGSHQYVLAIPSEYIMLWHLSLLLGPWGCGPFIYLSLTRICLKPYYEGQLLYPLRHPLHIVGVIGDNRNVVELLGVRLPCTAPPPRGTGGSGWRPPVALPGVG